MRHGESAHPDEDALDGVVANYTRFTAERPALVAERAAGSPLFLALETLRAQLEAALARCGVVHGDDLTPRAWLDAELARFFDDALAPAMQ